MLKENEKLYNEQKWLLKNRKKTIGSWLQGGSPIFAEIIAKSGLDWVFIDMEHGPGDNMTLVSQIQAIKGLGVAAFARAPGLDPLEIKRILDAGAVGVSIPYVHTKEQVDLAVRACKYPPDGFRGVAISARASGYGMNGLNYLENANEQIVVMIAIETAEAIQNLDEILTVPNLDGIFIGPIDLASSLGYLANPSVPEVQEEIRKIEKKVLATDKFLATVAADFDAAKILYERGYSFVAAMSDTTAMGKLAKELNRKFREEYPDR